MVVSIVFKIMLQNFISHPLHFSFTERMRGFIHDLCGKVNGDNFIPILIDCYDYFYLLPIRIHQLHWIIRTINIRRKRRIFVTHRVHAQPNTQIAAVIA